MLYILRYNKYVIVVHVVYLALTLDQLKNNILTFDFGFLSIDLLLTVIMGGSTEHYGVTLPCTLLYVYSCSNWMYSN